MIRRLTIKAYLTNFNATYIVLALLALGLLISLFGPPGGDGLYRLGLVVAAYFGLLTGTTLTEIKTRPLSFCLPGQEKSMGPAIVLCAVIVCLLCSVLLLVRPMSSVDAPVVQQALTAFLWSLGVYLIVAASAFFMRDSIVNSTATVITMLMLVGGTQDPGIDAGWLVMTASMVGAPVLASVFAALAITLTLGGLASRERSRRLCGALFIPLGAYDSPRKMREIRNRLRSTSFRPSRLSSRSAVPAGRLLARLSERCAGSSWGYLIHESRFSASVGELLGKLLYIGTFWIILVFWLWRGEIYESLWPLYILVAMTFTFYVPSFNARVSPMLPVSRGQHLRSLTLKAGVVYVTAVLVILALGLLVGVLESAFPVLASTVLGVVVESPVPKILVLALNVPLLCSGLSAFRSTAGYLVFLLVYMMAVGSFFGSGVDDVLLQLGLPEILILAAVCWLPFLGIAWKRCNRDDLVRS